MVERTIEVVNRAGIHARPSSMIVELTQKFKSDIYFETGRMKINAKSILGIITLGAPYRTKIKVTVDGPDEQQALDAIAALFASKFEEE
jgi:phosphocarrier protein